MTDSLSLQPLRGSRLRHVVALCCGVCAAGLTTRAVLDTADTPAFVPLEAQATTALVPGLSALAVMEQRMPMNELVTPLSIIDDVSHELGIIVQGERQLLSTGEPLPTIERFSEWEALGPHWRWEAFAPPNAWFGNAYADSAAAAPMDDTATDVMPGPDASAGLRFAGVGFPHIEQNDRPDEARYKPYGRMISYRKQAEGPKLDQPIPYVRCMGLSPEAIAKRADAYEEIVLALAMKHQISASLIKAVITEESCFNPQALSPVGAIGLMQLMPDTADWLKIDDPLDPAKNIEGGVRYLARLRKDFGNNRLALAAYNAGPGNVRRYEGVPPFPETQGYVQRVLSYYRRYVAATRLASRQS